MNAEACQERLGLTTKVAVIIYQRGKNFDIHTMYLLELEIYEIMVEEYNLQWHRWNAGAVEGTLTYQPVDTIF